jgi:hypothetical protein
MPTLTDRNVAADRVARATGASNYPAVGIDEIAGGDGHLTGVAIASAGAGYAHNDHLIVGNALINVDAVGGGGAITAVSIVNAGTGLISQDGAILATNGAGHGATFNIVATEIAPGLLDQAVLPIGAVASVWETAVSFEIGEVVIPTAENANGRMYRCVRAGLSGAAEPTWVFGVFGGLAIGSPTINGLGRLVQDGDVVWEEAGPAPEALWDLRLAEHLVWRRKQALAASLYDVGLDARDQLKRSQVFDHIERMVEQTAPFCVA